MKKSNLAATITVEWGYESHSIALTPRNWAAIKAGRTHGQRGAGYYYEGEFFWDYWSFGGGLEGELEVGYGGDGVLRSLVRVTLIPWENMKSRAFYRTPTSLPSVATAEGPK